MSDNIMVPIRLDEKTFEGNDHKLYQLVPPHTSELKLKISEALKGGKILAWEKTMVQGDHIDHFSLVDISDFDVSDLTLMGIWENLSDDIKNGITNKEKFDKEQIGQHMEKMRAGRRKKYENVPRIIECVSCHTKQKIAPGLLIKKTEKIAQEKQILFTVEDYLKTYECTECKPVFRGRKPNPLFTNLPATMK